MKPKFSISSIALLTLTALAVITFNFKGTATRPTSAVVDDLNGTIRTRSGSGQPVLVRRYEELPASITLLVPGTRRGSTEHWAHLRFRSSSSRNITLVQAGTDSGDSEYRFPCEHRGGTGLWGVRQVGSNACERITVNGGGWRSQLNPSAVAQKSSRSAEHEPITQVTASEFTVIPDNRLTLLYVYQTPDSTILNVLTGSVRVRGTSRSYVLRAGTRYIDYGDGADTGPIPENVYTARAVQIFLDPNNWSDDLGVQIGEFQRAVDQTFATAPLGPPDPGPITVPNPSDQDTDPSPNRPSRPQESEDDDYDEPSDQRPDPPDSAPPSYPPVTDSVPYDDPVIDYGGSSQPVPSTPPNQDTLYLR
jgi:hypothetical protein